MGIPSFYRWLLDRFPRSVVGAVVQQRHCGDGTGPNPNGFEFDNLYLDMNGIIHPCFHPEGMPGPKTYDEVFEAVFTYIDRLMWIVRPRKLLYLAIDGVAPRAKMNQQRSRRFRAAKDAEIEAGQKEGLGNKCESDEKSTSLDQSSKLDSNVITPGTEFMALLSSALRYYIRKRMNNSYLVWKGIKVILSDSSVPGEGEHKIMSYIRLQRNLPGYDPNTRHCLYGLDADLIMLALATHEIHFSIIREDLQKSGFNDKSLEISRKEKISVPFLTHMDKSINAQKFQFLHVWILREYLAYALKIPDQTVNQDLERLIDDFVFMCLFVGNDFLPHMPSLEISEGAIDLLLAVYKKEFVRMGGYLTNSFEVNLDRVKHFLQAVGYHECAVFRKRMQRNIFQDRKKSRKCVQSPSARIQVSSSSASITEVDEIDYGEEGSKERYYAVKFDAATEEDRERIRRDVVLKYAEGICWVMHYYYEGVCSWQWFYPYHYAPFCTDFLDIELLKMPFTLGKPFKPFDQLMAVLPAASAHALPSSYRELMTDKLSPIAPFYPTDFELDMNGKRVAWQAICKLPFIEESLLLSEIARVEHTLTDEERQRNSLGLDVLFIYVSHPLAEDIISLHASGTDHRQSTMATIKAEINPELSGGMNGYVVISDKPLLPLEIDSPIDGMKSVVKNRVLSLFYELPPFHPHITRPPEGVQFPRKSISKKKDIQPTPNLWHEMTAVVGRLHSISSIPHSISGHRLAKLARQLVSTWYLERGQKFMQSLNHGVVNIDGIPSCENMSTVCTVDALGDGELIGSEHRDTKVVANGPTYTASRVETVSVGNSGGDEPAFISNLGEKVYAGDEKMVIISTKKQEQNRTEKKNSGSDHCDTDMVANGSAFILNLGDTVSACDGGIDTSKQEHNQPGKENNGSEHRDTKMVAYSNSVEAIDVGVTETNGNTGDVGCVVSKLKQKQGRKRARLASDMVNSASMKTPMIGDTISAVMDESMCQLHINQMGGDKNGIDGGSGKRIIPNDHSGADVLSCHLNSENRSLACEAQGEKTIAVVLRDQVKDNDNGHVVAENSVRGGELKYTSLIEAIHVGDTETNGNTGDAGYVCKSEGRRKRKKKAKVVSDNIGNDLGMMSSTAMQTPVTAALILNLGDTTSSLADESTCQSRIGQTGGDKKSIDGEAWKRIIPNDYSSEDLLSCHLNLEKGSLADEVQGEKTVAVVSRDSLKDNDEVNVAPKNNVRDVLTSSCAEAIHVGGGTETSGNTGDAGPVSKLEKKRRRKKARLASDKIDNDLGMMSSTLNQTPVSVALTSKLGDKTPALMDESICQSQVVQTGGDKNNIEVEDGKCIISNDHSSADLLSCHLNLEKGSLADEAQGEKSLAVFSRNSLKANDEGNVVPENNVRGVLKCSSLAEVIHVGGGTETNGKTGDAGPVSKSEKKRRRKKARLATHNIDNDLGMMNLTAMQTPVFMGLTSKLGDTTPALMDESIRQSQNDQTDDNKNNIEGEAGKNIIPNDHSGADVLSLHMSLERSLAGEVQCEKSIAVVSSLGNDEGNVVAENNVRGGELMSSGLAEAIHVGGIENYGNIGEPGYVSKSQKKRKRKEKVRVDGGIIVNNVGAMSPDAMQTAAIPVSAGFNRG